jgi:hypothetical protein
MLSAFSSKTMLSVFWLHCFGFPKSQEAWVDLTQIDGLGYYLAFNPV